MLYSNYVGLIGQSKIGKTTLVKKIIAHFAKTKNFEFIFYLNFKEIILSSKKNCLDFLLPAKKLSWMKKQKISIREIQITVNEIETCQFVQK